jgi:hypothetical protein
LPSVRERTLNASLGVDPSNLYAKCTYNILSGSKDRIVGGCILVSEPREPHIRAFIVFKRALDPSALSVSHRSEHILPRTRQREVSFVCFSKRRIRWFQAKSEGDRDRRATKLANLDLTCVEALIINLRNKRDGVASDGSHDGYTLDRRLFTIATTRGSRRYRNREFRVPFQAASAWRRVVTRIFQPIEQSTIGHSLARSERRIHSGLARRYFDFW